LPKVWPFCWWLVVVIDRFSRQARSFASATRVVYGNDMKEYGFCRGFEIDSAGCLRKIGPETRYTIQS